MLHRESLATKAMSADFADVMDTVVKAVNFIKRSALQTRLFAPLQERRTMRSFTILRSDGFPVDQYWHASLNYAQPSTSF